MEKVNGNAVFVKDCPEEKKAWEVRIDDKLVDAKKVVLTQPKFGVQIELGERPEGYEGPIIIEPNGGGEVTLPYFFHPETDEIFVGLLMESRPNMGGPSLCIVGGLNSVSLSRDETQSKEAEEEAGMETEAELLPGAFVNSNRLFFLADAKKDEGIRICAVEVPYALVEQDEEKTEEYLFVPGSNFGKKPGAVIFKPWKQAVFESADVIAHSAIIRLFAHIS